MPPVLAFLAPDWLEALGRAAEAVRFPAGLGLVLQQVVTDVDGGDVRYHLVAGDGRLSVVPGQAAAPDLTLSQSYEVAVALSRGELNAQQALSAGLLKISGNVELLVRHGRALTALADVYAGLRDRTAY